MYATKAHISGSTTKKDAGLTPRVKSKVNPAQILMFRLKLGTILLVVVTLMSAKAEQTPEKIGKSFSFIQP